MDRRRFLSTLTAGGAGALLAPSLVAAQAEEAPAAPTALVWEHEDRWTKTAGSAAKLLEKAGFKVKPLPLDQSPAEFTEDVIFLGSFLDDHPQYAAYMKKHAAALAKYVENGRLLVQMSQTDQEEETPAFVPKPLTVKRGDPDFAVAHVLIGHALMAGLARPGEELRHDKIRTVWESYVAQTGFEVIIAGDKSARYPALLEAAHGKGRILLSAMVLDKPEWTTDAADGLAKARGQFLGKFYANIAKHALAVRNGAAAPLKVTISVAPAAFVPGSWTIAVLPDTQHYSQRYPGLFNAQTSWLVQNREAMNIQFMLHMGDITNNNTPREWKNANNALAQLDGKIPFALVPGNHDYGPGGGATTRDTGLNEFIDFANHKKQPTFGGAMEEGKLENTYHLFEAGKRKWIVIALEWAPRNATVEWADGIMSKHKDRIGILITHAFMFNNDLRYDHNDKINPQTWNPHNYTTPGPVNDGEELWQKLVRKHRFAFTHNGHVLGDGTGYRADKTDHGNTCHQILANYQMRTLGGEGYMRLMQFHPDGKTVIVKTYSPLYDGYLEDADQNMTLQLDV